MQGLPAFNPRCDAMKVRDDPGQGDDVPCEKCGAVALDTGLECDECGHDNWQAVTGKALGHNARLCDCRQCLRDREEIVHGFPAELCTFIVCDTCGNKRCPHATDHRNHCTGSNDVGQRAKNVADTDAPCWKSVPARSHDL